jgi:PAS domain S-box-containing protein
MKPVVVSSSPILDDNGVFQGSVTVFTDMTEIQRAEEIIRRAEAKYRMIVELASEGIGSLDREGNIEYVNDQMAKMFGYAPDEMIGTHYTGHMDESMIPEAMTRWQAASRMDSEKFDFRFRRKDGSPLWALVSGAPLYDDSGEFMGAFGMVSDITQRKEAEDELKRAKTLLQNVIEHMPVAVFLKDANDFKFKMLNRAAAGLAGLKAPEAALGKTDFDLSTKEQAEYFRKVDLETIEKGSLLEIPEEVFTDPAGKKTFLRSKKLPLYNELGLAEHILVISEDITREKQAREVIETALAEKEILLREVHHRVKNNLAIISSLLNLQSQHASDKPLAKVFEEIQLRIRSMASAHELLYGSPHLERIDAREYIHQLLDHISISQSRIGVRIEILREIEETSFGLDTAIPLGLLLTELVSNCLEHAFDHGQSGVALISLKRIDHERFELMVKDDGKGFPSDVEINNPRSMGLDLVNAFAEMLKGEIITDLTHGSEIRVLFKQAKKKN